MKKMMLLAMMMALAALMLAAAPALAQDGGQGQDKVTICHVPPGNPANAHTITVGAPGAEAHLRQHELDFEGPCEGIIPGLGQGPGQGDQFANAVPLITQETEQECESGDVDQSFNVSQTGDNSNQTVGLQGTANTGCAQNVLDVVDAGPFVGDFDNNNGFFNDGLIICDFDNDGDNDECEEIDDGFFNDGLVFCDRDGDGKDDGDDECFVIFPDFNDGFFVDGNDGVFFNDGGETDFEFEDVGATIELSPTQTIDSSQQVNQAAAASATWPWWK